MSKRPITWRMTLGASIAVFIAFGGMGAIIFALAGPSGRMSAGAAVLAYVLGVVWALTVVGIYLFAPRKA